MRDIDNIFQYVVPKSWHTIVRKQVVSSIEHTSLLLQLIPGLPGTDVASISSCRPAEKVLGGKNDQITRRERECVFE